MELRRGLTWSLCALAGCFTPAPVGGGGTEGMGASSGGASGPGSGSTSASGLGSSGGPSCDVDATCDDGSACTDDRCDAGQCVHDPVSGPGCTCSTAADCTELPPDDDCGMRSCDDGQCTRVLADAGTPVSAALQTAEDCQQIVCDGDGGHETVSDDGDVPVDGLECTDDVCTDGAPSNPPQSAGTACAAGTCNADGACMGCTMPADCGGTDSFCEQVTCVDSVCGVAETDAGTPLPADAQTDGDCQELRCDGRGNAAPATDDADTPSDDGNDCTDDVCQGSTVAHPDLSAGTACSSDGGSMCDGMGSCVECTADDQCPGSGACSVGACVNNAVHDGRRGLGDSVQRRAVLHRAGHVQRQRHLRGLGQPLPRPRRRRRLQRELQRGSPTPAPPTTPRARSATTACSAP